MCEIDRSVYASCSVRGRLRVQRALKRRFSSGQTAFTARPCTTCCVSSPGSVWCHHHPLHGTAASGLCAYEPLLSVFVTRISRAIERHLYVALAAAAAVSRPRFVAAMLSFLLAASVDDAYRVPAAFARDCLSLRAFLSVRLLSPPLRSSAWSEIPSASTASSALSTSVSQPCSGNASESLLWCQLPAMPTTRDNA